jgi:L-alanine-DL-glutamate epimerase-like enolase superfamily enzyme
VTGCYRVARSTVAAGFTYCPHFLGGGIGLAASAHILAAAGGEGLLELDVNPNPLRDAFLTNEIQDGAWTIGNKPGLGIDELPDAIMQFKTLSLEKSRP